MLVFVNDGALRSRQNRVSYLRLRGQVLVEIGEVVLHAWHVGRCNLFRLQRGHVEVREPGVCQDLVDAVGTEALLAVLVEELDDQVLCLR